MKFRDLEKVRVIIKNATGLDVAYAYDDLVFPEHAAFLIKFDDSDVNNLFCYFHEDCIAEQMKVVLDSLIKVCRQNKCTLAPQGAFNMEQKGEEVEIHFL